ncbi:MAG: hypothetical protein M3384_18535 [Acidobacteriota bacterium]|nr:hypothetical protein [Acidobacteriota bacterium]
MTTPAYPAARSASITLERYFTRHLEEEKLQGRSDFLAAKPDLQAIESIIDAAFWSSLQRHEGYFPKISLAFLPPAQAREPLVFEQSLELHPESLIRLAPAVERAGIHLGVWRNGGNALEVWGTTRTLPRFCFVLEVVEPGLLVVKYRRSKDSVKFVNVMALSGDQIKEIDEEGTKLTDCPMLLASLLSFGLLAAQDDAVSVLIQLAASMRAHGRGGLLLVVPQGSEAWRESVVSPVSYSVMPPFTELAALVGQSEEEKSSQLWLEKVQDAVEAIAGLTAVDGATVISEQYELLAFGTKIKRRSGAAQVEQVIVTEPVVGTAATIVHPVQIGGTRHLSAAQFVQDQPGAIALVASQDGRFTVFAWSPCEDMVHAHRIETLLF